MTITVKYSAKFRSYTGCLEESLDFEILSCKELYQLLQQKYHFTYDYIYMTVQVNAENVNWDTQLNDKDIVSFSPPTISCC